MLNENNLHEYQKYCVQHILDNPYSALFVQMGLGKTAITLTAINSLMFDSMEIEKVLVIAPKKVTEDTWTSERDKWEHLKHLRISIVLGTERQRIEALRKKADIYCINRENIAWLVSHYQGAWPFTGLVIDELSSFKNPKSQRFKALRMVRPQSKRVVGLTGTPAPNGFLDLYSQIYLLDQGQRLGKNLTGYRQKYFKEGHRNGHIVYDYSLRKEDKDSLLGVDIYEKEILDKIGDICISMKAEDYLDLPKRIDRLHKIQLSKKLMDKYQEFEKTLVLSLENTEEISPLNAAGLTNKLRQFANGAVYDDEKAWHLVHDEKLDALEEDVEAAAGEPMLIFYQYRSDLERITERLKKHKPVLLKGSAEIAKWNAGKIPVLIAHARSAGHGLNLQYGGHLISWFGVDWPLEEYDQGVARLDRQGQKYPVINTRFIVAGTIEEKVLASLENKAGVQEGVMAAVKALIKKYQ